MESILRLHIDASKERSLRKYPDMQQRLTNVIQLLFQDTVNAIHNGKKISSILRNHNELTIDMPFPSKYGIVTNLPVRELLLAKLPRRHKT